MKYFNESNQAVIKSWCNNPEESAIDQARNVAKLPFLAGPVVLCSDTHFGFGVPIGCVFATKGVVIPNAVGVDIACFTGDTKVKLTDNRDLTFLELIEEDKQGIQNFCFSLDNENNIVIEKI